MAPSGSLGAGDEKGTMKTIEERPGPHQFIKRFKGGEGCPGFYYLSWANGCPFEPGCAYCFLKATLWRNKGPVVWTDADALASQVLRWLTRHRGGPPQVLNLGELSETLAFGEHFWTAFNAVWPLFEAQEQHALLVVSKAAPEDLLERLPPPRPALILSWSITSLATWREQEGFYRGLEDDRGPASPVFRLLRAALARKAGYRVRLRFDPLLRPEKKVRLTADWIARAVEHVRPELVTLGTLRAVNALYHRLPEELRAQLVREGTTGHCWRLPLECRVHLYRTIVGALAPLGVTVGLCKEASGVWAAVFRGETPGTRACNCLAHPPGGGEQ